MGIIRLRSPELIVGSSGIPTMRKVLCLPAAAVVPDDDVELPVGTETDDPTVVITTQRLPRVGLERMQLDHVAIKRERRSVPHEAIDSISEERHVRERRAIRPGR